MSFHFTLTPLLVVLTVACPPPARDGNGRATNRGDSTPAASFAIERPWPIADSFPLQVPGELQPLQVYVRSTGPEPCRGAVSISIRRQATVLYADTLRMGPTDPCAEPFLGAYWESIHGLRSFHATLGWDYVEQVVPLEARGLYGSPPYIFVYANGWESTRALAWNPGTRTFDLLVEGGLW